MVGAGGSAYIPTTRINTHIVYPLHTSRIYTCIIDIDTSSSASRTKYRSIQGYSSNRYTSPSNGCLDSLVPNHATKTIYQATILSESSPSKSHLLANPIY